MTANLRKAFYSSGAKTDPADTDLLQDVLQMHREKLRRLSPDTEATRLIQKSGGGAAQAGGREDSPEQSFRGSLEIYFPQIPQWFGDVDSPLVCALLVRWSALEALQKARPDTLRSFSASTSVARRG